MYLGTYPQAPLCTSLTPNPQVKHKVETAAFEKKFHSESTLFLLRQVFDSSSIPGSQSGYKMQELYQGLSPFQVHFFILLPRASVLCRDMGKSGTHLLCSHTHVLPSSCSLASLQPTVLDPSIMPGIDGTFFHQSGLVTGKGARVQLPDPAHISCAQNSVTASGEV